MTSKRGFTLIELLAVIIILGVLMLIAVPSVTEYIGNARKKAYITTAQQYIGATAIKVNSLDLPISDPKTTYYVPTSCINLEKGGKSPYGEWEAAYVVVTTDETKYNYYWTSLDDRGNAILLTDKDKLTSDSIVRNIESLDLSVGVGNRNRISVFNADCTTQTTSPALSYIADGGSTSEGTTEIPRPVITLIGDASIEVTIGSTYTDLGATASDAEDGDITGSIVVTNEVDTNTPGVQYVRYNVTNSNGVEAIEVVRTVTVIDPFNNPGYLASEVVNAPMIIDGLTAVKWNTTSSTWDAVADPNNDTSWYDYANKQWANAKTADGSMWVWIPRYAYQIATNYHTGTAGTINVKFLKGKTNTASDGSTVDITPTYSGSSQTNYIVHPAFKFGTTELTGIWVSKFEMGGTLDSPDSKPGAASIVLTSIGSMFTSSRNMETNSKYGWELASGLNADGTFTTDTNNVDTHLMKNSEWGAAAYLAHSIYGKNAEVTINMTHYYAGGGSDNAAYITNVDQSTTGNIYGIYDMSGGAMEYVMGNYNNIGGSSGLTPSSINDKYIELYGDYSSSKFGDAIYETSFSIGAANGWYSDTSYYIDATDSWLLRGEMFASSVNAGVFGVRGYNGGTLSWGSWRCVLLLGLGF